MDQVLLANQGIKKTVSIPLTASWSRVLLLGVLAYEALGGLSGGLMLTFAPDGRLMDMPADIMNGVFADFFIPGIILTGMGILSSVTFFAVLKKKPSGINLSIATLSGWIIWFATEIIILQGLHWLHIMWGVPVLYGTIAAIPLFLSRSDDAAKHNLLMWCGSLSSAWYLLINIFIPFQYEGYSLARHTVSELSAIGAPTQILWVLLVIPYTILFAAFGWGVLNASLNNRSLRILGYLILGYSIFNCFWPPMHMRGVETTYTDTLHITWASVTVVMMVAMMGFGARSFGRAFQIYTFTSLALLLLFGILTALQSPNIPTNGPTPTIGIWERINIGVFMVWISVLAFQIPGEPGQGRIGKR